MIVFGKISPRPRVWFMFVCLAAAFALAGCRTPAGHRERADRAADEIIKEQQEKALGRTEPFTIERPEDTFRRRLLLDQDLPWVGPASLGTDALEDPEHWPNVGEPGERPDAYFPAGSTQTDAPIVINLIDALQIGAGNSRDYQARKESLFETALQLDLERFRFSTTFNGFVGGLFTSDQATNETGVTGTGEVGVQRTLETGADLSGRLVVDLTRLLGGQRGSSLGLLGDASISVPLLRGAGRHIVTEPRTQAERNVIYAIYDFELFKRNFAVRIADEYFSLLQNRDQIANAEANYERLLLLVGRTEALHERGRVTGIQVDQARQDLLRAREGWITATDRYEAQLDRFKITLGLPTDARLDLEEGELDRLLDQAETMLGDSRNGAGPESDEPLDEESLESEPDERGRYEIDEDWAIELAWENRLDLRIAEGAVYDAQRRVTVAADALRPGLNLVGSGTVGERRGVSSAGLPDARLDPSDGFYTAGLELDMPWSRRPEGVAFRESVLGVGAAVRSAQELEDSVKLDVRDALRNLLQERENYEIQVQALNIAERRVRQAQAFQEVGRAETRDVLEANEALLQAQNSLVDALVSYRVAELSLQRDLGVLFVDERGLWEEFDPDAPRTFEDEGEIIEEEN